MDSIKIEKVSKGVQERNVGGKFGENGFRPRKEERGLIDGLPFLNCRDDNIQPQVVYDWISKMQSYVMANYVEGMHRIFDLKDPKYPEFDEPVEPDDVNSLISMEKWKAAYRTYVKNVNRLQEAKPAVTGVCVGQIGSYSLERLKKLESAAKAIETADPLNLVIGVVLSHIIGIKNDDTANFYDAQTAYNRLKMGDHESLDTYFRRFQAAFASLKQSAVKDRKEELLPPDKLQTMHFVNTMGTEYNYFVGEYKLNQLKVMPKTLQEAFDCARLFRGAHNGLYHRGEKSRKGIFLTNGGGDRSHKGSYGSKKSSKKIGACAICKKEGHWKNECPDRDDANIAKAVSEVKGGETKEKKKGGEKPKKG